MVNSVPILIKGVSLRSIILFRMSARRLRRTRLFSLRYCQFFENVGCESQEIDVFSNSFCRVVCDKMVVEVDFKLSDSFEVIK